MYSLEASTQFKKDFKALSVPDEKRVEKALGILAETGTLPYDPYLTHALKGRYKDNMEAHLRPDLLLIWFEKVGNSIKLVRVGSHAKLFNK
ncbi:MAG: addiction module toxin, RelE/StbE family [bacterium F082]|nr:MAG: addiction module toxin, RelE/StbE family [bacterium F082]KWW31385.1 MAG: addiction module toxin, RelE/StbE family [bacterium P201]